MATNWSEIIVAGLGGGFIVKVIDYIYKEYRYRKEANKSAKDLIDKHIDPILKSADELVGKLRSLAQSDFKEIVQKSVPANKELEEWFPYLEILYLFAQFWSRIQILRIDGVFVNLGSDKRGKQLLSFFRTLESKKTRVVSRAWQRGIGESLMEYGDNGHRNITFKEFTERFLAEQQYTRWYYPLISTISNINNTSEKQRLLVYGVIIHALIETLDEGHLVTRNRPGWANKLSRRSVKMLKYQVFKVYLPFVLGAENYYESKK